MKNITIVLLIVVVAFSSSCKAILFKQYGIKQPAIENHESLTRFLTSFKIDTSEVLCFKDTAALNQFYRSDISLPDSRFFNKDKKLVDYRSSPKDCNGMVSIFIEKSDSINRKNPIPGETLDKFLKDVVVQRTGEKFTLEKKDYDIYLVMYWAKYLGKLNKDKVFEWQELAQKANQSGKKIRVILISADYQNIWGITKDQLPTFVF